jgi:hypothetical protein
MPAPSSSPIDPALAELAAAADAHRLSGTTLLAALAKVPDPRKRRSIRHSITTILALAVCAVVAGARSFTVIGGWAAARTEPPAGTRRALALDGKTVHGLGSSGQHARRPLAAIDHRTGAVLGQLDIEHKINEIRRIRERDETADRSHHP